MRSVDDGARLQKNPEPGAVVVLDDPKRLCVYLMVYHSSGVKKAIRRVILLFGICAAELHFPTLSKCLTVTKRPSD